MAKKDKASEVRRRILHVRTSKGKLVRVTPPGDATKAPSPRELFPDQYPDETRAGAKAEWKEITKNLCSEEEVNSRCRKRMNRAHRKGRKPFVESRTRGGTTQRDIMRRLWRRHEGDTEAIVRAWARAEASGEAHRASNVYDLSPKDYGRRLLNDGIKKGWIYD